MTNFLKKTPKVHIDFRGESVGSRQNGLAPLPRRFLYKQDIRLLSASLSWPNSSSIALIVHNNRFLDYEEITNDNEQKVLKMKYKKSEERSSSPAHLETKKNIRPFTGSWWKSL